MYYFKIQLPPAAPILVGPGSSASPGPTVSGTTQIFQWKQVTGATSYLLEVQDVTARTAVMRYTIPSGSTTSYKLSGLKAGDVYKWKVYAYAGSTIGLPSLVDYFKLSKLSRILGEHDISEGARRVARPRKAWCPSRQCCCRMPTLCGQTLTPCPSPNGERGVPLLPRLGVGEAAGGGRGIGRLDGGSDGPAVGAIQLQIGDDDFSHRSQVQGLIDLLQQLAFQFL